MNLLQFIINFAIDHNVLIYVLIALLSTVEGPIVSIVGGILYRWNYFYFLPLYIALIVGDLIGDVAWYYLGRHSGSRFIKRFGKFFGLTEENIRQIAKVYHKYQNRILIISKLTTGFGFATVVLYVAGMSKIPFKRYILINGLGEFIWTGMLVAIGYSFANLYTTFDNFFARLSIIAIAIILLLAIIRIAKYVRGRVIAMQDTRAPLV